MPLPKKPARKTPAVAPSSTSASNKILLEGTNIVVLDGKATITVHCDLKMSKNYQSGGASCGFTFVTTADAAEAAAATAFAKVREIVSQQMGKISDDVEDLA